MSYQFDVYRESLSSFLVDVIEGRISYHQLKTWPEFIYEVVIGNKKFEFRKDDRGFKAGDLLYLKEWDPRTGQYGTRWCLVIVKSTLRGFGIPEGYVIMSIDVLESGEGR